MIHTAQAPLYPLPVKIAKKISSVGGNKNTSLLIYL